MIKTWAEASQRTLKRKTVEWDGEEKSISIDVPAARNPVLIVFDNQSKTTLTATLQQLVAIDDTEASAKIDDLTIATDEPGAQGNEYSISVVVPESEEATDLVIGLTNKAIIITLAVDAEGTPDNTKNTVTAIVAAINHAETGIDGFTASGTTGTISTATEEPVQFTGGQTEVWADYFELQDTAFSLTAASEKTRCFGPFQAFPKFLKGRITLTAAEVPTAEETTRVIVQEV